MRSATERAAMALVARVFGSRRRYELAQRLARRGRGPLGALAGVGPLTAWTATREVPEVPRESFRDWWRSR